MRAVRQITATAVCLCFSTAVIAGAERTEPVPFCDFPGLHTRWSEFTHQGVPLRLPTAYERRGRAKRGWRETSFLGYVHAADFRTAASRKERTLTPSRGSGAFVTFLLAEKVPFSQLVRNVVDRSAWSGKPSGQYPAIDTYPLVPGPHGLTEVAFRGTFAERMANPDRRQKETGVFVAFDEGGEVQTVILCKDDTELFEHCSHYFRYGRITVDLLYDVHEQLPNWQRLENDMVRLLDCAQDEAAKALDERT